MEDSFHLLLAPAIALLGIVAAVSAYKAMQRGLTYMTMLATVWALVLIALSTAWHAFFDLYYHASMSEEASELIEYFLRAAAYVLFIGLTYRSLLVNRTYNKIQSQKAKDGV